MSHLDKLYRYLFENYAVRGELATVWQSCQPILQGHDYPVSVSHLLGEMLAATSLLTATLKFEGDITLQIQGDGPLKLAVINGNDKQEMRGIARMQGSCPSEKCTLRALTGNGVLAITLTPKEGERYQGMVALEEDTLAQCLETYFRQSEQLPTRLFLYTGDYQGQPVAGGILLQVLPAGDTQADDFDHLATLTETLTEQELFTLPAEEVLHRLYHQETVKLFPPQAIHFKCTCSRERCAETLLALPQDSLHSILDEDGQIDMHCDYCGRDYLFSREDVQVLLQPSNSAQSKPH